MEFRGTETLVVHVLRAREIQRLRRVRHLGLVHLVFPGGEHSRLVHSIGAAYLAIRFSKQLFDTTKDYLTDFLRPDPACTRDLAVAALCHDLGHGPLSHVWEREVIQDDFNRDQWIKALGLPEDQNARRTFEALKWHELATQSLLSWPKGELNRLLEEQEEGTSLRVRSLLTGEYFLPYLPRLISGDVDVDRCDFVIRDALLTGVAYGRYDLDWLISTVTVGEDSDTGRLVVGFDLRKAPRVLEQFLIARRALYDTVYFHKTVRSAEGMVGLLLRRLRRVAGEEDKIFRRNESLAPFEKVIKGGLLTPGEILSLDDYSLWVLIQSLAEGASDRTVADLAQRIISRDLFKIVPRSDEQVERFFEREDAYSRLYEAVAPFCPGEPDCYVYVDRAGFELLSDKRSEWAYFVDERSRRATPIRDHPQFRPYLSRPERNTRLFVPRQAVSAVSDLVPT